MTIGNLPKLPPIEIGYRLDPQLPVITLAMQVRRAGCAAPHAHPRGQLIYASSGVMRVVCGRDIWIVPPVQAVWVPPDQEHEVYFPGDATLANLFVDPSAIAGLPQQCCVLKVSALLRELILKAVQIGESYLRESPEWRLMQVILDELGQAEETPLHLPMARDQRVGRVIEALLQNPGDDRSISDWSRLAGASDRSLARLFVRETGLTLGAWRKRLVLQEAITRLDRGEQVTQVAFDLGYKSLSAFIEMFRKELGTSPRQFSRRV